MFDRRAIIFGSLAALATPGTAQAFQIAANSALQSGGFIRGEATSNATVTAFGTRFTAHRNGRFLVGLDRTFAGSTSITVVDDAGGNANQSIQVATRQYQRVVVEGLPQATAGAPEIESDDDPVTILSPGPAMASGGIPPLLRAAVARQAQEKQRAWQTDAPIDGFSQAFIPPLTQMYVTSPWGSVREKRYVSGRKTETVHYGVDLRGAEGTPVTAPSPGIVALAGASYYYEGNCVFIAHGQNLVTAYLHMSALNVQQGQQVAAGDVIGRVGHTGSANGPHLCWRAKCRGVQIDPQLLLA